MPVVLDIDAGEIDALARSVEATEADVTKAMNRALSRTARHVFTQVRRSVSKSAMVPQKVLRSRLRLRVSRRAGQAVIWVGLNPLNPTRIGARQTKTGVTARGRRRFPGAFIARGRVFKRRGQGRLPLDTPTIEIDQDVYRVLKTKDFPTATDFYLRTLKHELVRRTRV